MSGTSSSVRRQPTSSSLIKALNSLFHQGRVRIDDLRSAALGFDADALDELAATIKKLADEWRKKVA